MTRLFIVSVSLLAGLLLATNAQAVDYGYSHFQDDQSNQSSRIAGFTNGILFKGELPAPTVIQNDAAGVPAGAVGTVTGGTTGNPGGGIGVHLQWPDSVTLQGTVRDDLDPNTGSADPSKLNVYEIDVPLATIPGTPGRYEIGYVDGLGSDVTNNLTHRAWYGDNNAGHRQSGDSHDYDPGTDPVFVSDAAFNIGGNAAGDSFGVTAGVGGTAPNDDLFVDFMHLRGIQQSNAAPVFVKQVDALVNAGVITGVNVSGSGLAPEGTSVETGLFGEDALMFTDRTHQWNSQPGNPTISELGLAGADYIRLANDDKNISNLQVHISMEDGLKDIFVLIDNRNDQSDIFDILNGNPFADTGIDIGADEGGDGSINQVSSLFVLSDFEGTFLSLGPNNDGGNNYGIIVTRADLTSVPEPTTAILGMIGLAAIGVRRRRQA